MGNEAVGGEAHQLEEGVEGLIHVSEMSWTKKVRQPSSVVNLGDVVTAVIKEVDTEQRRISLSMKEAMSNPWQEIAANRPVGSVVKGKIRNITEFGIFVGLEEGIDGLVHISDMSWSQRQKSPAELYTKGQEIDVKILNIDVDNQRLSLGIKQLEQDPWETIEESINVGDVVQGQVVHIADFGVFVEITPGVEGLVHISEIDKEVTKKSLSQFYPISSEVQAKVINLSSEDRRLGLSVTGIVGSNGEVMPLDEKMAILRGDGAATGTREEEAAEAARLAAEAKLAEEKARELGETPEE